MVAPLLHSKVASTSVLAVRVVNCPGQAAVSPLIVISVGMISATVVKVTTSLQGLSVSPQLARTLTE